MCHENYPGKNGPNTGHSPEFWHASKAEHLADKQREISQANAHTHVHTQCDPVWPEHRHAHHRHTLFDRIRLSVLVDAIQREFGVRISDRHRLLHIPTLFVERGAGQHQFEESVRVFHDRKLHRFYSLALRSSPVHRHLGLEREWQSVHADQRSTQQHDAGNQKV